MRGNRGNYGHFAEDGNSNREWGSRGGSSGPPRSYAGGQGGQGAGGGGQGGPRRGGSGGYDRKSYPEEPFLKAAGNLTKIQTKSNFFFDTI